MRERSHLLQPRDRTYTTNGETHSDINSHDEPRGKIEVDIAKTIDIMINEHHRSNEFGNHTRAERRKKDCTG